MQGVHGRFGRITAAVAVAIFLSVGVAACGGGSSDGGGSDGAAPSEQTGASGSRSEDGSDEASAGAGELPDPCELVPIETASEILGGESAEPDGDSSDVGTASRSCSWQTQASIDEPTIDGAGHILTLSVIAPVGDLSMEEFWNSSYELSDEQADIDGCGEAFWTGGMLSALQDGVYLTGSAGLADDSADAKAATTDLVAAACSSLS